MGLVSLLKVHLRGIGAGERLSDRAAILILVALRGLAPLWRLFDRAHVHVRSPLTVIRRYRIRDGDNRWEVGGNEGAAYLFPRSIMGTAYGDVEQGLSGVCIDVGASFGWYTVRWARQVGNSGRVIALEPQPRHYSSLVRNIALNKLTNVAALPCAVGDHDGSLVLFAPAFGLSVMDASAIYRTGGNAIEVPMRSIDSVCDELSLTDVRLVKIDVEGFEPQVLRGMIRLLERSRPTIAFEALTTEALSACRAELPPTYGIRRLADIDYVAEPSSQP